MAVWLGIVRGVTPKPEEHPKRILLRKVVRHPVAVGKLFSNIFNVNV